MPYSVVGWFCDDVREEKGNKETIIGIYSDAVTVASFPGAFKRIVVYVRIHADVDQEINALKLLLSVPGLEEDEISDFSLKGLKEGQERARRLGLPFLALVTQVTIEPLKVQSEGLIQVTLQLNDQRTLVAAMLVRQRSSPANASEPPSGQSPPDAQAS
jgi:hypothetical protein